MLTLTRHSRWALVLGLALAGCTAASDDLSDSASGKGDGFSSGRSVCAQQANVALHHQYRTFRNAKSAELEGWTVVASSACQIAFRTISMPTWTMGPEYAGWSGKAYVSAHLDEIGSYREVLSELRTRVRIVIHGVTDLWTQRGLGPFKRITSWDGAWVSFSLELPYYVPQAAAAAGTSRADDPSCESSAFFVRDAGADHVNRSEVPGSDGVVDSQIGLRLCALGDVTAMSLKSDEDHPSTWDTLPGNGAWLIGVGEPETERLLNGDGRALTLSVDRPRLLHLFVADSGVIGKGTDLSLTVTYRQGPPRTLAVNATDGQQSCQPELRTNVLKDGASFDLVNTTSAPGPDQQPDRTVTAHLCEGGTLTRVLIRDAKTGAALWDTSGGRLVGVADVQGDELLNADGRPLNLALGARRALRLHLGGPVPAAPAEAVLHFASGSPLILPLPVDK